MDKNFLEFVKPFCRFIPEIQRPKRYIEFREKVIWTCIALIIFLIYYQTPVFGIISLGSADPFYQYRLIFRSNYGTLSELGILPMITSNLVIAWLVGTRIIEASDTPRDRALFSSAQKFCTMVISIGQATIYVIAGIYGIPSEIGMGVCLLIIIQLFLGSFVILLFDELLQKGYGLNFGNPFFTAALVCEAFRQNLPSLMNLFAVVILLILAIYIQYFCVDLPIKSARYRGQASMYPIKLLYTFNKPFFLHSTLISSLYMISKILSKKFAGNILIDLVGIWIDNGIQRLHPIDGLCYYLTPPESFQDMLTDPIHAFISIVFILGSCSCFSRISIDISEQLKEPQMVVHGYREKTMIHELNRYFPTAAGFVGLLIGPLTIIADFFLFYRFSFWYFIGYYVCSPILERIRQRNTQFGGMDRLLF
ncbi:hypothetical protein I4U23_027355 [Adineta vaga]|nr:hypothetical protein I4U23_027355 [Adineta vaga]